ncbi:LIM domain-containing protein 2 [Hondaea fermentalgiana]|uniref:LIM domain-containing protein 2 n=1 Tax=Hondaea fermentalgiana TaxID=2315210 RepID=A0A2R5GS02_9STRA|nr:LIM domain-containing protein 2 [Hondaea fermentalgiana]|eukprot:GBG31423.1 LIM domain-containing protein 2 [Hondaea fermentalgiana]
MKFGGGSTKCACCDKTVYKLEELQVDKTIMHKSCFKCAHCKRQLTLSNFAAVSNKLYCKTHFIELFHTAGGKYSVFGGDEFKKKESGAFASMVPPAQEKTAAAAALKTSAPSPANTASKTLKTTESKADKPQKAAASAPEPVFKADNSCKEDSPKKSSGKYLSLKERMQKYQQVASNSADEKEEEDEDEESVGEAPPALKLKHSSSSEATSSSKRTSVKLPSSFDKKAEEQTPAPSSTKRTSVKLPSSLPAAQEKTAPKKLPTKIDSGLTSSFSSTSSKADASVDATSPSRSRTTSVSDLPMSNGLVTNPANESEDDSADLRQQLAEAREKISLLQLRTESLREENEKLTEANAHLKKELAVQTAKALESDEWCAKLSQDLKSLKVSSH